LKEQKTRSRSRRESQWKLFHAMNYKIFFVGIAAIILGYVAMMQGPHDSFLSLHLSPILLVIGYCVLIPLAILLRRKSSKGD